MIPDTRCGKLLFYFLPSTELFAFEGRYSFFEKEREREREKHLRSPSRSIVENKISNQSIVLCVEKFFLFFNFSSPRGGRAQLKKFCGTKVFVERNTKFFWFYYFHSSSTPPMPASSLHFPRKQDFPIGRVPVERYTEPRWNDEKKYR